MSVVILCGGQGTRAYPTTRRVPKALMEVNGLPIIEQVMRIYAAHGFTDFILSCGYLGEQIVEYFDAARTPGWTVTCVDTGGATDTGGRIERCRELLTPTFHATYCDGLGDVDLGALVRHHHAHPGLATMTAVPLRSQYGIVYSDTGGRVSHFEEKPVIPDRWINAGFFVFDRGVFDHWAGDNLEKDVMPALAMNGLLYTYRHHGFWRSMDTYKDQQELNGLWAPYAARLAPAGARAGGNGDGAVRPTAARGT
jgi:glucose-1-phosphate cytidylyltransferase